jgi:hypothetical protein
MYIYIYWFSDKSMGLIGRYNSKHYTQKKFSNYFSLLLTSHILIWMNGKERQY